MSELITEKIYPVRLIWAFKFPIIGLLINLVALIFGYYFPYVVLAMLIALVVNPLTRANFHFALNDHFFYVKQGVISKKERNLPYGVIQNIFFKQDIFDRIFGISTLVVENAAQAGGKYGYANKETLGASGNKINIPGLKKADAEALKSAILQKIKANPIEDSQSGL